MARSRIHVEGPGGGGRAGSGRGRGLAPARAGRAGRCVAGRSGTFFFGGVQAVARNPDHRRAERQRGPQAWRVPPRGCFRFFFFFFFFFFLKKLALEAAVALARSAARSAWRMRPSASAKSASSCSRRARSERSSSSSCLAVERRRRSSPPCRRRRARRASSGSGRSSVTSLDEVGVALARGGDRAAASSGPLGVVVEQLDVAGGIGQVVDPAQQPERARALARGCSAGRRRTARAPARRGPCSRPRAARRRTARRSRTRSRCSRHSPIISL